jgi:hypothetical protein
MLIDVSMVDFFNFGMALKRLDLFQEQVLEYLMI